MYTIKLIPSGVTFSASDQLSILDSALLSNFTLQYGCKDGQCGICKSKVVSGEVNYPAKSMGISEDEQNKGYVLTCTARPLSNMEIEAKYFPELDDIEPKLVPCRVDSVDYPAGDIAIIKLRLPPDHIFKYLAGQYINLILNGQRRSYSIANTYSSYSGVELHIRRVKNGLFSDFFFNNIQLDQLLRLEGPFGTFFVRKSMSPIVFLAGGTGFAPVKAMVETLLEENSNREIYFYWGSTTADGFYSKLPESWQLEYENIHFIPVLSGENESWHGRRGLVHLAVLQDFKSLKSVEVYACGSSEMIENAKSDFMKKGLLLENFYSDAFTKS
jgi:CDP-4-dehydro-6-deoxyglucose reductase, E3